MSAPTSWRMFADTVTVGGWTSAGKLVGLLKVVLAARLFGAGDEMDAYLIAFLLPSFFIDMLAGPLDSGLIPTLVALRETRGKKEAEALYSGVLAATGACLTLAAVLTAAVSNWLLPMLASSFTPSKLVFTQQLLLVMIAIIPLSGLAATWRAVLNSDHRFAYAAAAPAITPVVSIVAMLVGARRFGVLSLALGTLAGATLEALATGIGVKRAGYGMLPRWTGITVAMRQVASQYAPLVAVTLVMTGSALIDQGMAARLSSGSVAALSYGTRLLAVLITIGPTAVGTAVLPHLSSGAALSEPAAMRRALGKYGFLVLALILPATAVLFYVSEPLIHILFQNSAFGEASTHLVAAVQRASLLQLPIAVLLALEVRLTSAMKSNNLLYHVAALSLILTFALDLVFMRWWGVTGIAFAGAGTRLVSALYLSCKIYSMRRGITGFRTSDSLT